MVPIKNKKIVVIGGGSGIGFAVAKKSIEHGAKVIIGSRDINKLNAAIVKLGANATAAQVDAEKENSVCNFFEEIGHFDHLHITIGEFKAGGLKCSSLEDAKNIFNLKFFGTFNVVKHAINNISSDGAITLYSGRYAQRPSGQNSALIAAVNGAIISFSKALALELSPVRVNVLSPGLTNTELFMSLPQHERKDFFLKSSQDFVIKRAASPEEIAEGAIYLMNCTYATGSTVVIDGGYVL